MKIKKFFKPSNSAGKSQAGFTLIELLVVIGIIAVLATIGTVSFGSASAKARDAKRSADIRTIQSGLEIYNSDKGYYPMYIAAQIAWTPFLQSIGVSTIAPPQTSEAYCYYSNATGTAYALVASDFEKDIPDTSSSTALTGLTLTSSTKGAIPASTCTDQTTAAISCTNPGAAAPGDLCIKGGL
ncbi:MAG: type II secretion system protein [Candidatus Jacksonbacteria bacterium]